MKKVSRVILIVMDSVGIGRAHDAHAFGDDNSNTLGNIAAWAKKNKISSELPTLTRLGLGRLVPAFNVEGTTYLGASARLVEISAGKDTTTGHWEMAGTPLKEPFAFFPNGFPSQLLEKWYQQTGLAGSLGNKMGSGTQLIDDFGEEHIRTGKPILYTSTDSVFQVAAHEKHFGLARLYKICEVARELTRGMRIGRVIARPFKGENAGTFKRTDHRKDFSLEPPKPNLFDVVAQKLPTFAIGKIDDIFCRRSIRYTNHTGNNRTSGKALLKLLKIPEAARGFIFANFIDFDQDWGHRRDPGGYLNCLKEFDSFLKNLLPQLTEDDLLIITADHGNDPTFRGSDHTRENVPLLVYSPNQDFKSTNLGEARGFFHIARLVLESLGLGKHLHEIPALSMSESFHTQIWNQP